MSNVSETEVYPANCTLFLVPHSVQVVLLPGNYSGHYNTHFWSGQSALDDKVGFQARDELVRVTVALLNALVNATVALFSMLVRATLGK